MTMQLELPLIAEDPEVKVNRALDRLEERFEKNRKSLHAKNSELVKITLELQNKVSFLERMLCKPNGEFNI